MKLENELQEIIKQEFGLILKKTETNKISINLIDYFEILTQIERGLKNEYENRGSTN